MSIYSFLIAVRSGGEMLTNEDGETTSHLMGMFYRTLRIVDNGIKPVYVFDGAPPKLKSGELAKRFQRKATATEGLEEAKETVLLRMWRSSRDARLGLRGSIMQSVRGC